MRIFMWAAVALIAIVVLQLRPEEPSREDRSHRPINGRTSQGEAVWAVERDGQIEVVELGWRFTCWNGREIRLASRFTDGHEWFEHAGRHFVAGDVSLQSTRDDGWTAHFAARIDGDLSPDGDGGSGSAHATVTWFDPAQHPHRCRTGPVRWNVKR
jgi:hypothetical protein